MTATGHGGRLFILVANAEGQRDAAVRIRDLAEGGRRVAQARVRLLEQILADVWRWTHTGHPHVELLTPILQRADIEYSLLAELDKLETDRKRT
jgi:hypothetical protein